MSGLNASVAGGWYTFTNLGPLTSTYTPAPSCTASDHIGIGALYGNSLSIEYAAQCTDSAKYLSECMPETTKAVTTTTAEPDYMSMSDEEYEEYIATHIYWIDYGSYYSPGVHCPAGWKTIGMVGRGDGDAYTVSGALGPTRAPTTQITATPTSSRPNDDDDYYYDDYYEDYYYDYIHPASIMKSALAPRQTMAVCCPSGMTLDGSNLCYSAVKDYKPTSGCNVYTHYDLDYSTSLYTITHTYGSDSNVRTRISDIPTATVTEVTTHTTSFKSTDQASYTGYSYAPAITLLHHESDVPAAENASAQETPSNAAGRLAARALAWDGLGSVVGIWGVAMVMGAAMVLS
ncbi:uncharacterized protein BDV17DRAFT_277894 [Aspergillus undulatus]|uniref:uncharacterized protein n=1 Tax=Aspergillus undulatus TaxID=1810928 RepID=UPI003CCDB8A5